MFLLEETLELVRTLGRANLRRERSEKKMKNPNSISDSWSSGHA